MIQTLLISVDMKTSIQEISWHLIAYYHHAEKYNLLVMSLNMVISLSYFNHISGEIMIAVNRAFNLIYPKFN